MNSVAIAKLRPLIMYDMSRPILFVLMLAKASYFNSDIGTHKSMCVGLMKQLFTHNVNVWKFWKIAIWTLMYAIRAIWTWMEIFNLLWTLTDLESIHWYYVNPTLHLTQPSSVFTTSLVISKKDVLNWYHPTPPFIWPNPRLCSLQA